VEEVRAYCRAMGLKLSYMMIGVIFYESIITPIDTLKPERME
jgi:hypothetical protein